MSSAFLFGKVSIQPMLPNCCSSNKVQIMQRMAARHSSHFLQLTSTLFLDCMITSLHLFPLPALPNDFTQLSSRCAQNAAEDSFPCLQIPLKKKKILTVLLLPAFRRTRVEPVLAPAWRLFLCLFCSAADHAGDDWHHQAAGGEDLWSGPVLVPVRRLEHHWDPEEPEGLHQNCL